MFTSVFKDRTQPRAEAPTAQQALEDLLRSRELRPYSFSRHCEIGPFVVDHVCRERSLIIELQPRKDPLQPQRAAQEQRRAARIAFLKEMGYVVLNISPRELLSRPARVLERIRAALS